VSSRPDDELRSVFAVELRERIAALDRTLEELAADLGSVELGRAARAEAHRLRGSAATLRLEALTAASAAAEELAEHSPPDAGSIRRVQSELAAAAAALDGRRLELPDPQAPAVDVGRPLTVLQIEDNTAVAQLLERFLSRQPNVTVLTAPDGETGLALARGLHPDVVLLDLGLPDLDGDEVLRRLRSDPQIPELAVVVVSGSASRGEADRLLEAGARRYLTKPLELELLLGTLRALAAESGG